MRPGTLVEVYWRDSTSVDTWTSLSDHEDVEPLVIKSAGYLVSIDRDAVKIVQSVVQVPDGDVAASLIIPRGCVISVRRR